MSRPLSWRVVVGVVAPLLALTSAGCGSNGGAAESNGFIDAFCELYRPCCAAAGLRSDGGQCRALYGAFVPVSKYDPVAGDACLAEMRAIASQPNFCDGNIEPAVCSRVFPSGGTKQPGATCTEDEECAPSEQGEAICASAFPIAGGEIRKCQVRLHGTAGSTPCVETVSPEYSSEESGEDVVSVGYSCYVSEGLRCDGATTTCVALSPIGSNCLGFAECVVGATCSFSTDKCVALGVAGAACSLDSDCVKETYCSDPANVCTARVAVGAACTDDSQCLSDNCVNSKCEGGSSNFALVFICGEP